MTYPVSARLAVQIDLGPIICDAYRQIAGRDVLHDYSFSTSQGPATTLSGPTILYYILYLEISNAESLREMLPTGIRCTFDSCSTFQK